MPLATEPLHREDAYRQTVEAEVIAITERGGIVLDQTPFYAAAGGQPGDRGVLVFAGGTCPIATTIVDAADRSLIIHVPAEGAALPAVGMRVKAELDWALRYKHMRMHTALHLLCSLIRFPVTGGQIGAEDGRLDFDIDDASAVDKDTLSAALGELIAADHPVSQEWITDADLDADPGLVRTLSVKPPRGSGRIRLVLIGDGGFIDRQPCGGTHVRRTAEIGKIQVTKIEKKGRLNRRIRLAWI